MALTDLHRNIPIDRVDGVACMEGVELREIAARIGTPFYCYSSATIRAAYSRLANALAPLGKDGPLDEEGSGVDICYAVKANGNLSVLRVLAELGAGADIVSGGELVRALSAGIPASRIVFSGVGKSATEIRAALDAGVRQLNVESAAELATISSVAREMGRVAPIAFRVNPDVDAKTHAKITTGQKHNKFGIDIDDIEPLYAAALARPELEVVGLALHIGSQITALEPYAEAYAKIAHLTRRLREAGCPVQRLDLGGGLGISYDGGAGSDPEGYARIVAETVGTLGCHLTIEPGRYLVAQAGLLVTSVLHVKTQSAASFAIVDAGMNDLMRPALYDAHHDILPIETRGRDAQGKGAPRSYHIAGPVCESTDVFARDRLLPELASGDLLAFATAGAYGAVLSSTYNARALVPEVLVDRGRYAVIRARVPVEVMLDWEPMAPWLRPGCRDAESA